MVPPLLSALIARILTTRTSNARKKSRQTKKLYYRLLLDFSEEGGKKREGRETSRPLLCGIGKGGGGKRTEVT